MFKDHNQMLDAYRTLVSTEKLARTPRILFHIDYHSDIYRNNSYVKDKVESIGNYINALVSEGDVKELWWIIPDTTELDSQAPFFWKRLSDYDDWQFRDGPADQSICVGSEKNLSFGAVSMSCEGKKVPFHKRTLRMFAGEAKGSAYEAIVPEGVFAGKSVMLDIDGDFFDYNGLYANWGYAREPRSYSRTQSVNEVRVEFAKMLKALNRSGMKPVFTSYAMSPEYIANNSREIENFGRYMSAHSKNGADLLLTYAHWNDSNSGDYGEGKIVARGEDAKVVFDLFSADRFFGGSDKLDLAAGIELNAAIAILMNHYDLSESSAKAKLYKIAEAQGLKSYIDLSGFRSFDELAK
jgi:hypothetical protein